MIVYFKWVNSVVCELYLKAVKAKETKRKMETPPPTPKHSKTLRIEKFDHLL